MRHKHEFLIVSFALLLTVTAFWSASGSGLSALLPQPGTWSQQTSGTSQELRSAYFTNESAGWVAGAQATLLGTTNGGSSWSPVNTGADPARGFNSVRFIDSNVGWVGGISTVARTTNAGSNWTVAALPTSSSLATNVLHNSFFPLSSTQVWTGGAGAFVPAGEPGGTLTRYSLSTQGTLSSDFNTVFVAGSGTSDLGIFDIHFTGLSSGWAVGRSGFIVRYTGSGVFPFTFQSSGTTQQLNGIQMLNTTTGWVVGDAGVILRTTNSGGAWMGQTSGTTANLYDVFFLDASSGWVVGAGGTILTTNDGGVTWTPEQSGVTVALRGLFFVNANTGYSVGANGTILKRGAAAPPSAVVSVSAASFSGVQLSPESIVAAFGQGLASTTEVAGTVPLPITLAGTSVTVRDSAGVERLASLFFVSPRQVNYLVPLGTSIGTATINLLRNGLVVATGTALIASVSPGVFAANANGAGVAAALVFRRKANGAETYEQVAQFDQATARFVALPIDFVNQTDDVFLVLFATGLRNRSALSAVTCKVGGAAMNVIYAGVAPSYVGLDQVNLGLPRSLTGRGEVDVELVVDGKIANTIQIGFK